MKSVDISDRSLRKVPGTLCSYRACAVRILDSDVDPLFGVRFLCTKIAYESLLRSLSKLGHFVRWLLGQGAFVLLHIFISFFS